VAQALAMLYPNDVPYHPNWKIGLIKCKAHLTHITLVKPHPNEIRSLAFSKAFHHGRRIACIYWFQTKHECIGRGHRH
jgi:hypothetical protein